MASSKFSSVGQLIKTSGIYVRMNFKKALLPLTLFSLVEFACVGATIFAIIMFAQFSEVDTEKAAKGAMIALPALIVFLVTMIFNQLWTITWACGTKRRGFLSAVLPLFGLILLFGLVVGVPSLFLQALMPMKWQFVVSLLSIAWALYAMSRGVASVLYVVRDRLSVIEAVRKSIKQTKNTWMKVLLCLFVFSLVILIIAAAGVGLIALFVVLTSFNVIVKIAVTALLYIVLIQALELCRSSFLMRLGETIEKSH